MKTRWKNILYTLKPLCMALCVMLLVSVSLTGSYAYIDQSNQHRTGYLSAAHSNTSAVLLQKNEKDSAGAATPLLIKNAAFNLYQIDEHGARVQMGIAAIQTDADGQIFVDNLEQGQYVLVETDPSYGYTYDVDIDNRPIKEYAFTVSASTQDAIYVQAYNRRLHADLTISNTVINADAAQQNQVFTFLVTFNQSGVYLYTIDNGPELQITSGDFIQLMHGQTALIKNLPVGTLYSIVEIPVLGYSTSSINHQGNITAEGASVIFTNTAAEKSGVLAISKTISGDDAALDLDIAFAFTVTFDDNGAGAYQYTINGGAPQSFINGDAIYLKHGETALFEALPDGLGYIVTEVLEPDSDYTAGIETYCGTVVNGGVTTLPFANHKTTENETGSLTISKTIVSDAVDPAQAFCFIITFDDNLAHTYSIDSGMPQTASSGDTITLKDGETAVFEELPVGLRYTVTEDDCTADGYVATIQSAAGTIAQGDVARVPFVNSQIAAQPDTKLIVKKIVAGNVPPQDAEKQFAFRVVIDGVAQQPFSLKHGVEQEFTLPYGAAYEIQEEDYFTDGYVQSITNGTGTAAGQAEIEAIQTNTYMHVTPILFDGFVVQKTIRGDAPPADTVFSFVLSAAANAPMPSGSVNGAKTVTIAGAGKTNFGEINYIAAGTYTYSLREAQGNAVGYTYDKTGFTLTVVVSETAGKLELQSATYTANGQTYPHAAFANIYNKAVVGDVAISGEKTWKHGKNAQSNQPTSITVYVKDSGTVVAQKEVTAADNWRWDFTLPRYDTSGQELFYTVDESPVAGYDTTIHGYNITNTYRTQSSTAFTGDNNQALLWVALAIASSMLCWYLTLRRRGHYRLLPQGFALEGALAVQFRDAQWRAIQCLSRFAKHS